MTANDFGRKRSKHFQLKQADLFPPGAQFGQNLATGTGNRAGGDENNLGILTVDRFNGAVYSIKNGFKFFFYLVIALQGLFHGQLGIVAHFHVGGRRDQLIESIGGSGIQPETEIRRW